MKSHRFELIGAAFDLTSKIRGCRTAPQVMRDENLMSRMKRLEKLRELEKIDVSVIDGGDVDGKDVSDSNSQPKYMKELIEFSNYLMPRIKAAYEDERVPVLLGGDHAISIASVTVAAEFLRNFSENKPENQAQELGLLWVDAHPDLETPENSESGNLHGMPVAHLLGYGAPDLCKLRGFQPKVKPENLVYIGLRDPSYSERVLIRENKITTFTISDIERMGIMEVCERAFSYLEKQTSGFVLSFDIDVCDPLQAPGVQYPEFGGLTYREAAIIMEYAAKSEKVISLEMMEVNPILDHEFKTTKTAIKLIESALGGTQIFSLPFPSFH